MRAVTSQVTIKTHEDAIERISPQFHNFLSQYKKNIKCVYGFTEGKEDLPFYRRFISFLLPDEWWVELVPVGNRDKVIRLYSEFDWNRYPKNRIAFFIDRDLSDILGERNIDEKNLYITDKYSIENSIANRATCESILTDIFELKNLSTKDKKRILDLFEEQLHYFLTTMITIMAWIIYWRCSEKKPNLSNIKIDHIFSFSNGRIQLKLNPGGKNNVSEYIHNQCQVEIENFIDISCVEDEIKKLPNHLDFIRGKYVASFFALYVKNVYDDIGNISTSVSESPKIHVVFGKENAILYIALCSRMPYSIRLFLERTFCDYIRNAKN
jgi:hypothetical protein